MPTGQKFQQTAKAQAIQRQKAEGQRNALNPFEAGWQNQNIFEFNPYREGTNEHKQWQQQQAQAMKDGKAGDLRNNLSQLYDKFYASDVEAARVAGLQGGPVSGPQGGGSTPTYTGTVSPDGQINTQVVPQAGAPMQGTREVKAQLKYDAAGRPIRNNYTSITDAQGRLGANFSLADKMGPDIQANTQSADTMRQMANATGPSTWATLAEQSQRLQEQQALSGVNRDALANQNRAYNSLAQRGGLSQGQRERLAMQTQRSSLGSQQQIMGQGMQSRLNIGMQDQQQKNQMLGASAQADLANANFQQGQRAFNAQGQQFDINNALRDVGGLNAYNSDAYGKAMQEWGAQKQSEAQAKMSGGGKK